MRDLLLFVVLAPLVGWALVAPHLGVLLWLWVSVMAPHRLVYGFLNGANLNLVIAIVTFIALFISREKKSLPMTPTTWLVIAFVLHFTLCGLFAFSPEGHWLLWDRYFKSFILILLIMAVMNTRTRIHSIVWIIVLSLGYYGVKGGAFVLKTGGNYTIFGPESSVIADNNHLALALVMTVPLFDYLRLHSRVRWIRIVLIAAMALTIVSVIGSYSRGGFVALLIVLAFFWWRSKRKVALLVAGALLVAPAIYFMPERWTERMGTIENYQEDSSLQGRFDAWRMAFNLAKDRPLYGGGLGVFYVPSVFHRYNPGTDWRAAHSIYFEVLGNQGFLGLFIFLLAGANAYFNARWVARRTRKLPEFQWAHDLAVRAQVSMAGYFTAGALLTMAYFEVYWTLVAILAVMRVMVARALAAQRPSLLAGAAPQAEPRLPSATSTARS